MSELLDELIEYSQTDYYPFHMPGHKRIEECDSNPYSYDLTEIDGMDNLYEADGILQEALERASRCYGSDYSYYLVNGSTCGIMTAIFAATEENDRVLVARNCHGSVYKSIYLRGLIPEYIYPEIVGGMDIFASINPDVIEEKLKEFDDIRAVIITSPTYEGIISDIEKIAKIVHKYDKILIVDEAHGSHLGFHDYFPKGAVKCGADIVVQSMHKTMKGLTQTGLLHIKGQRVDSYLVKKYLGMFQTSSPSYVLMSSIDSSVSRLLEFGPFLFENYVENLKKFIKNVENFTNIKVFNVDKYPGMNIFDVDRGKLVIHINSKNKDARYLYDTLRDRYHLQMEMVSTKYVLAMTSIADTEEGFNRLYNALSEIDREIRIEELFSKNDSVLDEHSNTSLMFEGRAVVKMSPKEVEKQEKEFLNITDSIGKISCEYIYMYPPGIPILTPGEIIMKNIVKNYVEYKNKGYNIYGPRYNEEGKIQVVKEDFKAWERFFT